MARILLDNIDLVFAPGPANGGLCSFRNDSVVSSKLDPSLIAHSSV